MSSSINENIENAYIRDSISNKIELLNRIRFRDISQLSLYQINTLLVAVVDETLKISFLYM